MTHQVSVVIVSWNTRQMLLDALASFLPWRDVEGEVVVVDNASADGSADAVEEQYPDVQVIRNDRNLGFAGGVNTGLRAARYPWVLLLNTDTLVIDDAIARLLDYAAEHPEVGIAGPRVRNGDGSFQPSCLRFPSLLNLALSAVFLQRFSSDSDVFYRERSGGAPPRAGRVDAVSGCCFLIRDSVLEKVGVLDEGYFMYVEEIDLCYRAWRAGFEVHYAPVGEITHFFAGSSRQEPRRNTVEYGRSTVRFFHKHHGVMAGIMARVLLVAYLVLRVPYQALRSPVDRMARARLGNHIAGIAALLGLARRR